ncbi:unnamed protein product [Chironomus riparius]|uniref:glutathione transferase n=1 Tax=Chironomus riparius TaxID=315576 RepID=A0A9N9RXV0_9DIPT|nr:unnamed protein product [Chironomus riparius]
MLRNDKRDTQLYYTPASGPCRAVMMVAAALKLKLSLKPINLMAREQYHPGFLKVNPHHSVPALVDNEFTLSESRAICIYLVEKYGRTDALYPKNPKTRGTINQLIYFDMGTLFKRMYEYYIIPFMTGTAQDEKQLESLNEAVGYLENFLADKKYLVSYRLTIADLILYATVSTIEAFGFDFTATYPNITNWLETMKDAPGYDQNTEGIEMLKSFLNN